MTTHPSDWRNASARTKGLALLALIGIIVGVVLSTIFSAAAAKAVAPTLIARNTAGETLLANSQRVFLVAADEASTMNLALADLGLRGPIMSVSSDGADWFLGDDATGMLHRCDLQARKCVAALQSPGDRRIFRRAHRVAFAPDRIFMTDSESHRLLTFDRAGHPLTASRTTPVALCFPNGMVMVDDQLYIADTNNFRIARVAVDSPRQSKTFLQTNAGPAPTRANCNDSSGAIGERGNPVLNTAIDSANTVVGDARPPARADRVWPASVLRTRSGEWWVIQMANRMRMGDVIRYSADGTALGRVNLAPDADPIGLAEARGSVLITDMGLARVHRVTLEGKVSGAWGPPDFQASLRAILADREFKRRLHHLSIGLITAGVLAALLVVVLELRRQRAAGWTSRGTLAPVAMQPVALGMETIWIPLDADVLRRVNWMAWILAAYALASLGLVLWLARDLSVDSLHDKLFAGMVGVVFAIMVVFVGMVFVNAGRMSQRRIGVRRDQLQYQPGSGEGISAQWDEVRAGSRSLLIGSHLVQIIDPRGRYLYPQQQIEAQLLSRLPPTAFLGNVRLTLEALRRGNVGMWTACVVFALYLGFILLRLLEPDFMRQAGERLVDWFR